MKPAMTQNNGGKTGSAPGMLQDDDHKLSMWLSTRPNARQDVRDACDRINASMHRPSIVDAEACAPEGMACCRDLNSGRGPDCAEHPRRSAPDWAVWVILGASIMGTLLIIHFGVQA